MDKLPRDLAEYRKHHRSNKRYYVDENGYYCLIHYYSLVCKVHPITHDVIFGDDYAYSVLTVSAVSDFISAFAPNFFKDNQIKEYMPFWKYIGLLALEGITKIEAMKFHESLFERR